MSLTTLLATLLFLVPTANQDDDEQQAILELGREHCRLFYDKEFATLWERLSDDIKQALGGQVAGLQAAHYGLTEQLGEEVEVADEQVQQLPSGWAYVRQAKYVKLEQPMDFVWQFDKQKAVVLFVVRPTQTEAETRFLDYETKTALRLPFEGQWDVFWGGRTLPENYHTAYQDQRFAYDFLIMKDGVSHTGDGQRLEDYYCFGQRLFAPAAGVIVSMANDQVDNKPGVMNAKRPLGNHVIIDHENGEFSFMAHFKQGTVTVKQGERVKAGDFLGLAGNSGNTTEPHLHYHLQTTAVYGQGEGLPAQFLSYHADGELVERGEPVRGQVVEAKEGE